MITYLARESHFIDHLAPVWALTGGQFFVPAYLRDHALRRGVTPIPFGPDDEARLHIARRIGPVVTASIGDHNVVRRIRRQHVLLNHGSGQTFKGDSAHPSYSGGPGRNEIALFLETNTYSATATLQANRHARVVVCGSPKLDRWAGFSKRRGAKPVIAVAFHWDNPVFPETRSAWEAFKSGLPALAREYEVIGHGHPRIYPMLSKRYPSMGIEPVADWEEVMARADLYINDASSTLYEFAATGRPVVVLNAPWYRRNVNHGLRFWTYADVGVNCDRPDNLLAAVEDALNDTPERAARRREITAQVYPYMGEAARRAAAAINELASEIQGGDVAVEIYYTRRLPGGQWSITGTVGGVPTTVEADLGDDPSMRDAIEAMKRPVEPSRDQRLAEVREPSPPPDFKRMTVAAIRQWAAQRGIELPARARKDELIAVVRG